MCSLEKHELAMEPIRIRQCRRPAEHRRDAAERATEPATERGLVPDGPAAEKGLG